MCCKLPPYFTTCVKQVIPWPWYQTREHSHSLCFRSMLWLTWVMHQSHPTTAPIRFLSPVRFIARKAEWSVRRNFASVLFSWSHQATGPVRLDTAAYLWFGWIIRRTPWVPPVRCPYGHRTGPARESSMFFISYWTSTGLVRDPQGCRTEPLRTHKEIDTTRIGKNPARASYLAIRGLYGPLTVPARAVHGLITISKPVRGP